MKWQRQRFPLTTKFTWVDAVIAVLVFALLYALVSLGAGMGVRFSAADQPTIHLVWRMLPYYAGRSLLRMFIAFFFSLLFTFVYARYAATHRSAQKIMIPLLDILQSVPVLGFLSITVTGFMGLFPHRLLGLELASIFAIFTGQVWNMTFSLFYSITSLPRELQEAATLHRLDPYSRFTRLELPYAAIGLVWNSMMSFGGGWFFLAASESISVLNRHIQLPGIGSYMATAMQRGNIPALLEAMFTMVVMIVVVDQLFWRPLVAWAQRFKMDTHADEQIDSWFLHFLRRSRLAMWISNHIFGALFRSIDRMVVNLVKNIRQHQTQPQVVPLRPTWSRWLTRSILLLLAVAVLYYGFQGVAEIAQLGWLRVLHVVVLGVFTLGRVMCSTTLALLWTVPVGVAIGLHPRASRMTQPLVQIAASFPANMAFPLITLVYLKLHVNFQVGSIFLMMLGTQWYILFNVIAGAQAIPSDLKEVTQVLGLRGWDRWRRLLLPAIFPYVVTGCITASGGAWNASIIAELVTWKQQTLVASGLGAYITQATTLGQWPAIVLSIIVMAAFVTSVNRLVWRPMQAIAEKRFRIV